MLFSVNSKNGPRNKYWAVVLCCDMKLELKFCLLWDVRMEINVDILMYNIRLMSL